MYMSNALLASPQLEKVRFVILTNYITLWNNSFTAINIINKNTTDAASPMRATGSTPVPSPRGINSGTGYTLVPSPRGVTSASTTASPSMQYTAGSSALQYPGGINYSNNLFRLALAWLVWALKWEVGRERGPGRYGHR